MNVRVVVCFRSVNMQMGVERWDKQTREETGSDGQGERSQGVCTKKQRFYLVPMEVDGKKLLLGTLVTLCEF